MGLRYQLNFSMEDSNEKKAFIFDPNFSIGRRGGGINASSR